MSKTKPQVEPRVEPEVDPFADFPDIMGKRPVLRVPDKLAERYDVMWAAQEGKVQAPRLNACMLGLAWPDLRRRLQVAGRAYTGDVALYGGWVLEYLIEHGVPFSAIAIWAVPASNVIGANLPGLELAQTKPEVDDAVGN